MSDWPFKQCLDNTTNSYKYFWFLALIEECTAHLDAARVCEWCPSQGVHEQNSFLDDGSAWYPIGQAVGYGSQDKLAEAIKDLIHILNQKRSD